MPRFSDPFAESISLRGSKPQFAYAEKPQPLLQARKIEQRGLKGKNEVTYCVLDDVSDPKAKDKDRRQPPRKRTRLRCGKILDRNGKFLIECQVHDRTVKGAHLRLMSAVTLPRIIQYFDDEQRAIFEAEIIWRKNTEVGIHFLTKLNAQALNAGKRSAVAGKYYAVS
jgi:hypothetical protein